MNDLDLLRRYEPVIQFTQGELFYPFPVDEYVERCSLWMRDPVGNETKLADVSELTLEKLAASLEQSQIDKRYVIEALRPRGRMQAFLPDNYQHPRVQALLNDLKTLLANESEAVESINDILSGETKAGLDTFREAHEDTSEGNIPKVLLQP